MKQSSTLYYALILSLLLHGTCINQASARGVRLSKKEMTDMLQLAFKMNMEADNELYERMEKLVNLLCRYKQTTGHFPQSASEDEHFSRLAAKILLNNPYEKSLAPNAPKQTPCKLHIIRDGNLNYSSARTWVTQPPAQWRESPGTIHIITNGENLLLAWGTGSSSIPIREPGKDCIRYCFRDINASQTDG